MSCDNSSRPNRPNRPGHIIQAESAFRGAWHAFCGTFYDEDRNKYLRRMQQIREYLAHNYQCELSSKFFRGLEGYRSYRLMLANEHGRQEQQAKDRKVGREPRFDLKEFQ